MESNVTVFAQIYSFVLLLCSLFLLIFVPVLLLKLNKRVKNIEDIVTGLQRHNEKTSE
jgi:F0F1-type ATP synthase membrane subunit b/b'